MQVFKFGGSSLANASAINQVMEIIQTASARDKTIVVASALSGVTDTLIQTGIMAGNKDAGYRTLIDGLEARHLDVVNELHSPETGAGAGGVLSLLFEKLRDICRGVFMIGEISPATCDLIAGFGELFSTRILEAICTSRGLSCCWADAREIIRTNSSSSQPVVNIAVTQRNVHELLHNNLSKIIIVPGFIASDDQGRTTTLGRGGSDYTASLLAVAAKARMLWIWTDVNGMMTADPRIVPQARTIENISYKEALEISHFGARVVYPPTIQPVVSENIPIMVKNTFDPEGPGTLIEQDPPEGKEKIRGISGSDNIALLSMEGSGMVGIPGYSSRLFNALAQQQINIILITQASSVHTMLVAIDQADAQKARKSADETFAYEISLQKVEPLKVECGYSIISLIGDDMKNQSGASGRMFEAIGRRNITIRAIAQGSSEKNVSAVVCTSDAPEAIRAVHQEFFGSAQRRINLFIAGWGNVGKSLTAMIFSQQETWAVQEGVRVEICGICNSKRMIIKKEGLEPDQIRQALDCDGELYRNGTFIDKLIEMNLRNCVFADCTADHFIALRYEDMIRAKIAVVTCNKIANTLKMDYYRKLRSQAVRQHVPFLYETNVGAALPVICLIRQMRLAGDTPERIEACLSGTLNYVFSRYDSQTPFRQIVDEATRLGYAEPDPMTDLSGKDVVRKTLILARECGMELEENQVETASFLPVHWPDEEHFRALYRESLHREGTLRYVSTIDKRGVKAGLEVVPREHPFSGLRGTDVSVILYSRLYPNGLRVEGAGAGARQTAAGLINDIFQCV
ncbi:MAG: bifunctional aspartate kinase/homoserine dehydrogenase I [Bacteroidales bacterium]|nr:bifunctional aspartate kinase/homoserine dehydrogenase I [Bacteroidales bacterium]MDD4030312.1 bifunctional aspartate kinase/homoserine dehydrogenase I [Bacteroidales bacterium]MDD4434829.1 bifunctional aspartate kinase/homoserine dehydrogenase I [Bacteroidales bacterium]